MPGARDVARSVAEPAAAPELREAEAFLFHEADLLDHGRFEEWMALFTDDGYYWVPSAPDQTSFLDTVSHFYDDRPMMAARIRRLQHSSNLVYGPHVDIRAHRHVGNVRLDGHDPTTGDALVASRLLMVETHPTGQRIYSGACTHALRRVDGAWRLAFKKVVLVNCDGPLEALGAPF